MRAPPIPADRLTLEQKTVCDEIFRITGRSITGPFAPLLPAPHVAAAAVQMFDAFRSKRKLEERLFEFFILVIARQWSSQFEWHTHEQRAIDAGLAAETAADVRDGRVPATMREDERMVYDVTTELQQSRSLSEGSFNRALEILKDRELVVELIAGIGFYTMVAIVLNSFDVPIPAGKTPLR